MTTEYEKRVSRLLDFMDEKNWDVALVTSPLNIYYFTGFLSDPYERFLALAVDNRTKKSMLFVPALDEELAHAKSTISNIIPIADGDNPYDSLSNYLDTDVGDFAVEKMQLSLDRFEKLKSVFSMKQCVSLDSFITSLRLKKSTEERIQVKKAINIIEDVLKVGVEKVTPGMTELELTAELEYQMRVLGADGPSFSTIVLSGENTALPHGHPSNRKLKKGDFLLIDMGVIVDGYCSDITRTFLIGDGTAEQHKIYQIVLEATQKAIAAIKMGEPLYKIDEAGRNHIIESGYGKYFNNRIGHGLGIDVHEAPSLDKNNTSLVEAGMLFTIEPGIYIPGFGGVRIEENIYVHPSGKVEVLTSYPRKLTTL